MPRQFSLMVITANKCVDLHILEFSKLLTNDSQEYCQSGAENRPSVAWYMAGFSAFYRLLADFYVEYTGHTIFSIFIRT
jgi:hypothetical protein